MLLRTRRTKEVSSRAPHCHLWAVRLYSFLPHYLTKERFSKKKVTEYKMCVLIFSTILSETFLIIRRTEQDTIKNVDWSSSKVLVIQDGF